MSGALLHLAPHRPLDERAARRTLLDQVARLEEELAGLFVSSWPRQGLRVAVPAGGGPARILSLAELEELRDGLAGSVERARVELAERTLVEEGHRRRIEEMLLHPDEHRWTRVSNADIGEPGCRHWHARPRWGILGMFASWWRVVVSSGCPLARALQ
jgi:hypothetical protein